MISIFSPPKSGQSHQFNFANVVAITFHISQLLNTTFASRVCFKVLELPNSQQQNKKTLISTLVERDHDMKEATCLLLNFNPNGHQMIDSMFQFHQVSHSNFQRGPPWRTGGQRENNILGGFWPKEPTQITMVYKPAWRLDSWWV